jgi:negative regulator of flagellin synthesis FlgM
MSIKDISSLSGVRPADPTRGRPESPSKRESSKPEEAASGSDQLTLTSVGQLLAESASAEAPVDRAKVEALREAIANGSYEADAEKIADKMLRMERELL